MSRIAVDCHMVGAPAAGDAGNGRYAAGLARALALTAPPGAGVAALLAHAEGRTEVGGAEPVAVTPRDVERLAWQAPRALARWRAGAAVFTYVAPPRSPCPVALAVHDTSFVTNPEWLPRRARAVLGALVRPSARRAAVVLALSQTARADLVAALGLDPARVRVVPPYPAQHFTPDDAAAERVRARFGLGRYVLAVGDINPRKNLGALVAAVERLRLPGLELALVGRPASGAALPAGAPVRWLGRVDDGALADLYRAAAVTAYPSLYEGFGLPVIEALACGSPVVASARGAIPEVAGDAALLTEPTPAGIAEGLRAALEPAEADRLRSAGPLRAGAFTAEAAGRAGWAAYAEMTGITA